MKMRLGYMPLLSLAFMLGSECSAHGQSTFDGGGGIYPSDLSKPEKTNSGFDFTGNPNAVGSSFRQSGEKLAFLKRKLIEALTLKDEKIITDVKGEVKDVLNEHFAHDLAIRESELARLIKRADNAESQNKQRLDSKDELIELQLQSYVMDNDAPGASPVGDPLLSEKAVTVPGSNERYSSLGSRSSTTVGGSGGFTPLTLPNSSKRSSAINSTGEGTGPGLQQTNKATIEKARMKLARAVSADDEAKATKELKEALSVYFLHDLEERDRLLKAVRADIEKMKQKLEKRSNSKSSIVDLQFKLFVNEASGLGFFSPKVTATKDFFGANPTVERPVSADPFGGK